MGSQSTAKTVFLLVTMVGWLLVGAALMYLSPAILHWVQPSDRSQLWLDNLSRGGYHPDLALAGGGLVLLLTTLGTGIWYRYFEGQSVKGNR
jgi:hypothetical protein